MMRWLIAVGVLLLVAACGPTTYSWDASPRLPRGGDHSSFRAVPGSGIEVVTPVGEIVDDGSDIADDVGSDGGGDTGNESGDGTGSDTGTGDLGTGTDTHVCGGYHLVNHTDMDAEAWGAYLAGWAGYVEQSPPNPRGDPAFDVMCKLDGTGAPRFLKAYGEGYVEWFNAAAR